MDNGVILALTGLKSFREVDELPLNGEMKAFGPLEEETPEQFVSLPEKVKKLIKTDRKQDKFLVVQSSSVAKVHRDSLQPNFLSPYTSFNWSTLAQMEIVFGNMMATGKSEEELGRHLWLSTSKEMESHLLEL